MTDKEPSNGDTVDSANTTKVDPYRYRMDFPCAGICVIINNINFHPFLRMNNLNGCDYDAAHVGNTFEKLGYKVYMFKDVTTRQMKQALKSASLEDHSNSASFVCVILSHGDKDVVYGTDRSVALDALTKYFKGWACQSLLGKPKLFFINACRGDKSDKGADVVDSADAPITYRIPLEADFLYAYSTSPGYLAWMHPKGSFFIKAVCEVIEKHGDLELMQIMTRVNGIVAQYDMPTKEGRYIEVYKQMPSVTSMLTKEFYFPEWFKRLTL